MNMGILHTCGQDSVILCDDIMKSIEDYVKDKYGNKYYNKTIYKNKSKIVRKHTKQ